MSAWQGPEQHLVGFDSIHVDFAVTYMKKKVSMTKRIQTDLGELLVIIEATQTHNRQGGRTFEASNGRGHIWLKWLNVPDKIVWLTGITVGKEHECCMQRFGAANDDYLYHMETLWNIKPPTLLGNTPRDTTDITMHLQEQVVPDVPASALSQTLTAQF